MNGHKIVSLFFILSTVFQLNSETAHASEPAALTPVTAEALHNRILSSDGKLILVNFWSTWCQPCKEEMPELIKFGKEYQDRGLDLVFVSMDFDRLAEAARDTLLSYGGSLPSYLKRQKDHEFITGIHPDWSGALPATFLFEPDGSLINWWNEQLDFKTLEAAIIPLLRR
jgi:thiol-disulfide isomerase/thioredoxin